MKLLRKARLWVGLKMVIYGERLFFPKDESVDKSYPTTPISIDEQPKGHILKAKTATFNPDHTRRGGRIVKAMPKDLRKMKEAQERPVDSQMPVLPKE